MREYNTANPKYHMTLIGTLVTDYGGKDLAGILAAAKKVKETASTAKKMESELIQNWIRKGWTPSSVFNLDHVAD
ncbi:hypothetical protein GN958_ATG08529 [Phytophthora infestans]|uniref:Uncharacterized protein n=1 Tax=Phytophthora infestans TaxID=4787 RepID=A0A8S9UPC4_PHYIN|nr:hypothetical protein GN958_ATG08529 [Phytophthora infestans]